MLNVFTYWEGERPDYIKECLRSFTKLTEPRCTAIILTPKNINAFLDNDFIDRVKLLPRIAHRADCYRVAIICKYGGLWVDADTVFIKSPIDFCNSLDASIDFFYSKWNDGRILNGYFYARKECDIINEWLNKIEARLSFHKNEYSWTEFGEQIIIPLVAYKHKNKCREIDRSRFLPVNIDKIPHVFFERVKADGFINDKTIAFGLNHSFFVDNYPEFVKQDSDALSKGNLLIHDILRRSI